MSLKKICIFILIIITALFLAPADARQLIPIGAINLPGVELYSIDFSNNQVFAGVRYGASAFMIIDVLNPYSPNIISMAETLQNTFSQDIEVSGGYVYIADRGHNCLQIFNARIPAAPQVASLTYTQGFVHALTVQKNLLYLANCWDGLRIINISDPYNPIMIGQYIYDQSTYAEDIEIRVPYAYIPTANEEVVVVDVSNPYNPQLAGCDTSEFVFEKIAIYDNAAYVSMWAPYIEIFDISDPHHPIDYATINITGDSHEFSIYDHYLIVAANSRLSVFDISNPFNPICISQTVPQPPLNCFYDVVVFNGLVYASGRGGLVIYDFNATGIESSSEYLPQSSRLVRNYPNPFNNTTTIKFTVSLSEFISLSIYDYLGRKVTDLNCENILDGNNQVRWNGRDDEGKSLSTGIYFCKLITNKGTQTSKMILLK